MTEEPRKKLQWFLDNLDLVLEDLELERLGVKVDLYFDTSDVIGTALGFHRYGGPVFDREKIFQVEQRKPLRDRVLVHCLAYDGELGVINMLPPHQAEFLASLSKNFRIAETIAPSALMVRQFLEDVTRLEVVKHEAASFESMDDKGILDYVRQNAGSAMKFFKIIQLIRGITWQRRLWHLRDKQILQIEMREVDYVEIVHSDNFRKLKRVTDQHRPNFKAASNFADAAALAILASDVERFNGGFLETMPRFFASSNTLGEKPLFLNIIRESGLEKSFEYESHNERRSSAFRQADYFVFKSTLQRPSHDLTSGGEQGSDFTNPNFLPDLRDRISHILQSPRQLTPGLVNQIIHSGRPLGELIDDLNTFLFFTNVWMPSPKDGAESASDDFIQTLAELESPEVKHQVSMALIATREDLQKGTAEYQIISSLSEQIEKAIRTLRRKMKDVFGNVDYFRDFGLLRFGFPEGAHSRIKDVLEALLEGDETMHYNVISACYMAHQTPEKHIDDLAAAASVLWVSKMYPQLAALLEGIIPLPHYSLQIAYAAAVFETNQDEVRGSETLKELEARLLDARSLRDASALSESSGIRELSDLEVGLAYLFFHLWERRGYRPKWDQPANPGTRVPDAESTRLVNSAIRFAKEAYELIGDWDLKKKAYALNQYLYYVVKGGDDEQMEEMYDIAEKLLRYKSEDRDEWWQYRFDDTLAWYFYRRSLSDKEAWDEHIGTAIDHAERACNLAAWDEKVTAFRGILLNKKDKGYPALGPNGSV